MSRSLNNRLLSGGHNEKPSGFSYPEILIAVMLFAIAIIAIIPLLTHAGRNMAFAHGAYGGHLKAQRMMLVVSDAITNGDDPALAASIYAGGDASYSVWVNGDVFSSACAPAAAVSLAGSSAIVLDHSVVIIAIVWCEDGQVLGRAIGMVYL